jgi:rfaE bifunctional protein nucleotidyltransferase chain/domain
MSDLPPRAAARVVDRAEAARRCAAWRGAGLRVVLASGVFDLLHAGHARALARARALGDRLVAAVGDDLSAAALAGPGRPAMAATDRAHLVAALRTVDLVVVLDEPAVDALLLELRPAVHAIGTDRVVLASGPGASAAGETVVVDDRPDSAVRDLVERVRARPAHSAPGPDQAHQAREAP